MSAYIVPDAGGGMARLTGNENYLQWSQEFQIASQYRGIWDLISTKVEITKPDEGTWECRIANASSDNEFKQLERQFKEKRQAYQEYQQRHQYAKAFLAESIEPKLRHLVQRQDHSWQAWTDLSARFQVSDTNALKEVQKKTVDLRQKDCSSLRQYLLMVEQIRQEIVSECGSEECNEYDDDACKLKIISGLNPEYVSGLVRQGFYTQEINDLTLGELGEKLLEIEAEIKAGAH